jgi:hypothetical protein
VTDERVLFLNRLWMFGACASSLEQAFYLSDLQVGARLAHCAVTGGTCTT